MKYVKRLLLLLLVVVVLVASVVILNGYKMHEKSVQEQSVKDKVASIQNSENYVGYSELPKQYLDAIVAVEDHRFYKHRTNRPNRSSSCIYGKYS